MSADRGTTSGLRLLAGLFAIYLLSYGSVFRLDDEHILATRANSLGRWGAPGETQVYGNDRVRALLAMGDPATAIEPLQTLVGAALLRLTAFGDAGSTQTLFLLNLFVTVATAGLVGINVAALGFGRPTALWCTALFGLATMAFPYSTSFFRDSLAMLFTAVAFLGWTWMTGVHAHRFMPGVVTWVVGIGAGALSKNAVLILAPAFALSAVAFALRKPVGVQGTRRPILLACAALLAGLLLVALIPKPGFLARYRWEYYVSLGQFFLESLRSNLSPAILGPFLSPAKSIFLFSPALLLLPLSLRGGRKLQRFALPAGLAVLGLAVLQALFYRDRWAEASGWGLRFMLPALPILVVLLAPAVERLLAGGRRGLAILSGVLGLGFIIGLAGAWTSWSGAYSTWLRVGLSPDQPGFAWDLRFLVLPYSLRGLTDPVSLTPAWIRMIRAGSVEAWIVPLGAALLGSVVPTLAARLGEGRRRIWIVGCLVALTTGALLVPRIFAEDPVHGGDRMEFRQARAELERNLQPGDVVVVDSYATPLWAFMMNFWDSPNVWYSLPFDIPPADPKGSPPSNALEAAIDLFQDLSLTTGRVWYLGSTDAPDFFEGRKMEWLDGNFEVAFAESYPGSGRAVLRLYLTRLAIEAKPQHATSEVRGGGVRLWPAPSCRRPCLG